jgi:hypothetical protein
MPSRTRGHILARTPSFEKKGKVSIWLGVRKPDVKAMDGVDILKDLTTMSTRRKWPLPGILFPRQLFFVVPGTSRPGGYNEKGESSVLGPGSV